MELSMTSSVTRSRSSPTTTSAAPRAPGEIRFTILTTVDILPALFLNLRSPTKFREIPRISKSKREKLKLFKIELNGF